VTGYFHPFLWKTVGRGKNRRYSAATPVMKAQNRIWMGIFRQSARAGRFPCRKRPVSEPVQFDSGTFISGIPHQSVSKAFTFIELVVVDGKIRDFFYVER
jgi:hypothetical protein